MASILFARPAFDENLMIAKDNIEFSFSYLYGKNTSTEFIKYGITNDIELIPIGFKYRFYNFDTHQGAFQLNFIDYKSNSSSMTSKDENNKIYEENTKSYSIKLLNKILYKYVPNRNFNTNLEFSSLFQINKHSEATDKLGLINQLSIEQIYKFYKYLAIGIKLAYLKGYLYDDINNRYFKSNFNQAMYELNLYFPISSQFSIIGVYNGLLKKDNEMINPYSYDKHYFDKKYFGVKLFYRFNLSKMINFFKF